MWLRYQLFHGVLRDTFMLAKHKDHITEVFFWLQLFRKAVTVTCPAVCIMQCKYTAYA